MDAALRQLAALRQELGWEKLQRALETATTATLHLQTPQWQEALHRSHEQPSPSGLQARADLRVADAARQVALRQHERDEEARSFATFETVRGVKLEPDQRLRAAFRYLRKAKRDWREVVQRQAQGATTGTLSEEPHPSATAPTAQQLAGYAGKLSRCTAPGPRTE